ncbi:MAG: DUF6089 family protein [Salinivirgaceae bacterium]|nr:DUF6089 family protein [Salinivirgaceae bacterium]
MLQTKYKSPILLLSFMLFISVLTVQGQRYNWKKLRYEVYFGGGLSNFMGDVGTPLNQGLKTYLWINPQAIRPVGQIGGKMAFSDRTKLRANLAVGLLANKDRYGGYPERGLEFRSPIIELSGIYEYFIIKEQKKKTSYRWLNLPRRFKNALIPTYVFAGLSGIYFNPQAYTLGEWHNLHPLHTEGQGLPGQKKHYSRFSLAVPIGIGVKFKVSQYRSISIEAGWRVALTDYIDDVSVGSLVTVNEMRDNFGDMAAILYYRRHGSSTEPTTHNTKGVIRGGKWIDQYQFVMVNYSAILKTNRKGGPKLKFY